MNAVKYFVQLTLEDGLNVSKIILFGSQANGAPTEESDIDIVIVSEDFRKKDIFERAMLTKKPEIMTIKKFMLPLDVITMTPEEFESESSLIAGFAKTGKVVYAA
jgi:predicted nucleotidyltransferase